MGSKGRRRRGAWQKVGRIGVVGASLAGAGLSAWAAPGGATPATTQKTKTADATQKQGTPTMTWLDPANPKLGDLREVAKTGDEARTLAALLEHYRKRFPKATPTGNLSPAREEEASLALQNKQKLFGLPQPFDLGTPANWTKNPTDNIEFIYSINRHALVRTLADAYAATGEEKYGAKAIELMLGWIQTVPPTEKAPWRELEVAIRGQVWASSLKRLVHASAMTPQALGTILSSLSDQIDTLVPAENWAGGNHGVNASWGMMYVGLTYPELAHAQRWSSLAWERLQTHMQREVYADGAQIELTSGYHAWCISRFHDALDWAEAAKLPIPPAYPAKLEKMYDYVLALLKPDRSMPVLGDSEMPNGKDFMKRGAEQFKRADMLFIATDGKEGRAPAKLDYELEVAGYYSARDSWSDPNAVFAMLDVAHKWGGWHAHFDALELHLYGYGRNLLPESGTINYTAGPRARSRATASHSTVTVDGKDQSEAPAVTNAFYTFPQAVFIDGSHQGYPGVTHRRQLLFVRGQPGEPSGKDGAVKYLIVVDRITGSGKYVLEQKWHLPRGEAQTDPATRAARTAFTEGGNLEVRPLTTGVGSFSLQEGWITPEGGSSQSGIVLKRMVAVDRYEGPLPVTMVTLLLPYGGQTAPELKATLRSQPVSAEDTVQIDVSLPSQGWSDTIRCGSASGQAGATVPLEVTRLLNNKPLWQVRSPVAK